MLITPDDVLDAAKGMLRLGLVAGTAGNVSGRIGEDRICLTPSSVPYETMTVDDLVITDLAGTVLEGKHGPTSEKASIMMTRSAARSAARWLTYGCPSRLVTAQFSSLSRSPGC